MLSGFLTDLHGMELFFRFCRRFHVTEEQARMGVLGRIAKRGSAKYLRDISPAIAGKQCLWIKRKRSQNAD